MAIINVTFNEDHLRLIANLRFMPEPNVDAERAPFVWPSLDLYAPYGGDHLFEDIARTIGRFDEHIEGTEEDYDGAKFSEELTQYMYELHSYIMMNIGNIEEIVHAFSNKGGLQVGTYTCKSNEHIWKFKE